jgi:hypothetical protein
MYQLANDELKHENYAAILTLYIQLRQNFKLLYSVFLHIFYNFKRVSVLKCFYNLHIRQKWSRLHIAIDWTYGCEISVVCDPLKMVYQ